MVEMIEKFNEIANAAGLSTVLFTEEELRKTGFLSGLTIVRQQDNQKLDIGFDDEQFVLSSGDNYSRIYAINDQNKVITFVRGFCFSGLVEREVRRGLVKRKLLGVIDQNNNFVY